MRRRTKTICIGFALMIGLTASPSARAEERTPCLKIKQVCEEAGFRQNALTEGIGLQVDCIRPIIEGTKQRQAAVKPLPIVDAAVVAACKAKNPKFGVPNKLNDLPDQPNSGSDF
jgi:hypothetical protein